MADTAAPGTPGRRLGEAPRAGWRDLLARVAGRRVVFVTELVLVLSGCVFLAVGGIDVGTAGPLPSKVFGGILALVGCGLLASVFGLRPRRRWTGGVGSVSLTAAAAIALYLCLNAWDEERTWAIAFAAICAGCVLAIVVLVRECPPAFSIKSASILSVAGFVLAFFQFTYAESARVRVGSTLTLSADLAPAGEDPVATVAATVRTANPTGVKIQSLGSLYAVEGIRHCRRAKDVDNLDHFLDVFEHPGTVTAFSPRVAEREIVTIQAGKVFDDLTYFEPGEEVVRRFSVPIPESRYDVVRLRVALAVANGERLHLSETVAGPAPVELDYEGLQGVAVSYRVSESSLVDRIVHGDRIVEVVWQSGTEDVVDPRLTATVGLAPPGAFIRDESESAIEPSRVESLTDRPNAAEAKDLSKSYGLTYARATTELPLERGVPSPGVIGIPDTLPAPVQRCRGES